MVIIVEWLIHDDDPDPGPRQGICIFLGQQETFVDGAGRGTGYWYWYYFLVCMWKGAAGPSGADGFFIF